ncbi:hypothetical protein GFY24_14660 [Nocardia sp. SYP-A9097]|uniref:DUF7373 family lipoprotein n=1 Tax=Nocardia sp. SYP-A9097 TaxID=2663237 RepID=UPI00129A21CA|nr:hypothetical protein [Nocardia sp. SYP-A9097]MRH88671.1 hypothetical protein [Nocardia sp. SYP-A9097]
MRYRSGRFAVAAIGLLLLIAACGGNSGGTIDYGSYPVHRIEGDFDQRPSRARGILAESLRLGERIVLANEVDSDLSAGRGGGVLVDSSGLTDSTLSGPQRSALQGYSILGGYSALAGNKPFDPAETSKKFLAVSILAFPDEQTAAAAAADMEHADFLSNIDNAPVGLDAYPTAISHWRPGVPTLGSWLSWKSLVIRVFAELPAPDFGKLAEQVTKTLRLQVSALERFTPTPVSELPALRLDPDGLLPLLVKTDDYTPDDRTFAVYSTRAFAAASAKPAADFEANSSRGVTSIAVSHNKMLYRLRDAAAATEFTAHQVEATQSEYLPMHGVANRNSIVCAQAKQPNAQSAEASRFRCLITRGEYVAKVYSNTDIDVRRLAAAQDSVLSDRQ